VTVRGIVGSVPDVMLGIDLFFMGSSACEIGGIKARRFSAGSLSAAKNFLFKQ